MDGDDGQATVRCVAGHDIPYGQLQQLTTVLSLDNGAEVRVCDEHGAPISVDYPSHSRPPGNACD